MIGISQADFKKMGYTHYFNHGNGKTTVTEITHCENCNEIIQAPNAFGGSSEDIPFYKRIGMIELTSLPEEGYYSDELEGEACNHCNG